MFQVRINTSRLKRKLGRYRERMSSDRTKVDVMRKGAAVIEKEYKNGVPVLTGRLRDSINTKVTGDSVQVGSFGVEYAGVVEYGSSEQSPRPILRTATKNERVTRNIRQEYKKQSRRNI